MGMSHGVDCECIGSNVPALICLLHHFYVYRQLIRIMEHRLEVQVSDGAMNEWSH